MRVRTNGKMLRRSSNDLLYRHSLDILKISLRRNIHAEVDQNRRQTRCIIERAPRASAQWSFTPLNGQIQTFHQKVQTRTGQDQSRCSRCASRIRSSFTDPRGTCPDLHRPVRKAGDAQTPSQDVGPRLSTSMDLVSYLLPSAGTHLPRTILDFFSVSRGLATLFLSLSLGVRRGAGIHPSAAESSSRAHVLGCGSQGDEGVHVRDREAEVFFGGMGVHVTL